MAGLGAPCYWGLREHSALGKRPRRRGLARWEERGTKPGPARGSSTLTRGGRRSRGGPRRGGRGPGWVGLGWAGLGAVPAAPGSRRASRVRLRSAGHGGSMGCGSVGSGNLELVFDSVGHFGR